MKIVRLVGMAFATLVAGASLAPAQTWTKLTNQPTFQTDTALLMIDGRVMVHEYQTPNWWALTPDNKGSYLNGTWSKLASMPSNYGPLYFASAVLPDGNVIVEGGEYNLQQGQVETNKGAFYNYMQNKWTAVNPPSGWTDIGDSPAIVLPSGQFFMGRNESTQSVLFNEKTLTWTATGTGKQDTYSEEGFVKLPDGTILTVDTTGGTAAEKYIPSTAQWVSAGSTINKLYDPVSEEIGPNFLLPNGTAFATGANASGSGHTSIYTPPANPTDPGTWAAGPNIPNGNDMADAPGAVLVSGNVLCSTSPGIFNNPVSMYEYNGTSFVSAPTPDSASSTTSYEGRFLALPTGQILYTVADGATIDVELYTPAGNANPSWAPTITSVPSTIVRGTAYKITGTQFNGVASGADYGDDAQMATNYPQIRITNAGTGHVFYVPTAFPSTSAVATGSKPVSTHFEARKNVETGSSMLEVVTNGIASAPVSVTIQ